MKTSKRYQIELSPSWAVGIRCVYVEVKNKTRSWSNGPIITDSDGFSVLTTVSRRAVLRLVEKYGDIDSLLEAIKDEHETGVTSMDVRRVLAKCKTNRRYLYVPDTDDFMSEADLIVYSKENAG